MAIEVTLVCDSCGGIIHAAKTARAARAEAQLQVGAVCTRAGDFCADCRTHRAFHVAAAPIPSHSVGTRR